MPIDRALDRRGAAVVQQRPPQAESPQRRRPDFVRPCSRLRDAVAGTDVVQEQIGEKRDVLAIEERIGARAGCERRDMAALPFPPASFDLVTTGYGLRNVPDLAVALREIQRVLKPGGTLLSLDFNRPLNPIVRAAYLAYLDLVGGALGWALHRDPDTYRYIPASIRRYPGAEAVAQLMRTIGFSRAEYHPVLGGLMAIHHVDPAPYVRG